MLSTLLYIYLSGIVGMSVGSYFYCEGNHAVAKEMCMAVSVVTSPLWPVWGYQYLMSGG